MQIAVQEIKFHEEIGTAVELVSKYLGRWDAYLDLHPAVPRVRAYAVQLFAQVINFCVRATRYYQSNLISKS
jgi:hypothetical protein